MLINDSNKMVQVLLNDWRALAPATAEEVSQAYQKTLAKLVIEPATQCFPGELILKYHEFLHLKPTGEHSFAYGSTMGSETVYWVTLGRMTKEDGGLIEQPATERLIGPEDQQIRFVSPRKFLLPVEWKISLRPCWATSHSPCFAIKQPDKKTPADDAWQREPLDLSDLGQHLFRVRKNDLDWATKIFIVVGNESVMTWLDERQSSDVYVSLQK